MGIDRGRGPNVDVVGDAARLLDHFGYESKDTVICYEMLEHTPDPLTVCKQMRAILRPGGWLIITTPGNGFPEHRYPKDYWRLMPDAIEELCFAGCDVIERTVTANMIQCFLGRKRAVPVEVI